MMSSRWIPVWLLVMALAAAGCDVRQQDANTTSLKEALVVDTTGYARANPAYRISFPEDHGAHPDFYLEWWYFTGNLENAEGQSFGYQFTTFRNAMAPPDAEAYAGTAPSARSEWRSRQLYSAHFAISDPERGIFLSDERYARGAAGLGGAKLEAGQLEVWVEDWRMSGPDDLSEVLVEAAGDGIEISLTLKPAKPIFLQGDQGFSPKGRDIGQASHYYSVTRLETEGSIVVDGRSESVTGLSWFDREWSTSLLSEDQRGWDWFSLQLDSGEDLMFFRLRSDTQDYVDGTLVSAGGTGIPLDPSAVELTPTGFWTSPSTDTEYPIAWTLRVPEHNLDLTLEATIPNQELSTRVSYWEGAVRVSGTRDNLPLSGRGFAELTGYGS